MEDGIVTISRAAGTLSFPAKFIMIAASNPCPCGYLGDEKKQCRCLPGQIIRYQKRLSDPILDRIDLHVEVSAVKVDKLTREGIVAEESKRIRKRVQKARDIQIKRFQGLKLACNAEMQTREVKKVLPTLK